MNKRHKLIAKAYDKKGNQLSVGFNDYDRTHPVQLHFAKLANSPKQTRLHAEIHALLRCRDKVPFSVSVERYDYQGNPALARPCKICMIALREYGVRWVNYTDKSGWIKEKLT